MERAYVKQKALFRFLKRPLINPIKLACLEVADITFKDFYLMAVGRWVLDPLNLNCNLNPICHRMSFSIRGDSTVLNDLVY